MTDILDEPSPPSRRRKLSDRLVGALGIGAGDTPTEAEPGITTSPQRARPVRRAVAPRPEQPSASGATAPRAEGRRGVDYEVVSTRRGPGTWGALLILVVLGLVAWMVGSRGYRWVSEQLDPPGEPTGEIVLTLPPGSSTASISDLLGEHGVVPSSRAYEWYVRLRGGPAFQAGEYRFQSNSSVWETMAVLEAGPSRVAQAAQQPLTIPEGLTVAQMAALLDEVQGLSFSGRDFLEAIRERPVLSLVAPAPRVLPDGVIEPAEGQLFADTYFFDSQTSAEQLVALMVDRLDAVLTDLGYDDAPRRVGLTPYEALIVASMIEREAQRPEDRAKVARVIYNRLARGWSLGLDATVVYVVGDSELTAELLAVNSPYNTRVLVGLPPTPIASPGGASLEAALNPEDGPWMYFVLTSPDGTLSFSVTDEEFQRDKAVCQELGLCG
ncbi:endolytic transglycosylase MltG [Candidatus Poriferisodalis sp.]|uniref:endolytic transglycosylase MltG n=1 Tax=Candidatus Poriferisodalis sp. TaxID=3101277 RepID=UPI003B02A014